MTELKLRALQALLEEYAKELDPMITLHTLGRCIQGSIEDAQDPIKDNRYSDTIEEGGSFATRRIVLLDVVHDSVELEFHEGYFASAFPDAVVTSETLLEEKISLSLTVGLLEDRGADPEYICPAPKEDLTVGVADPVNIFALTLHLFPWFKEHGIESQEGKGRVWTIYQRDRAKVEGYLTALAKTFRVEFVVEWE